MSPVLTVPTPATTDQMTVRDIARDDFDEIIDINQGALEGVGPLDPDSLGHLVDEAHQALVLDDDGDIAGFVITLPTGADYESSRYDWFEDRLDDYVYLDRIVVASSHRRQGVASRLYDEVEQDKPIALEIYDTNDASLAFHHGRGFEEVGEMTHGGKVNLMLVRDPA